MSFTPQRWSRVARWSAATMVLSSSLVLPARAIEMFTSFGDGSRIGLPNLEVPVQAYPGIPLRSDRIRARARAQQLRRAAVTQPGVTPAGDGLPGIPGGGITVRPMAPQRPSPVPPAAPAGVGFPPPPAPSPVPGQPNPPASANWSHLVPGKHPAAEPVAPPRPSADPGRGQTLPGFNAPVFPGGGPTGTAPRSGVPGQDR